MGKWTYMMLNIFFFSPVLIYAWIKFNIEIKKERWFIFFAGILGFILFFIVDPIATFWGAWTFDYNQTLGIKIGKSVIEELIWAIAVSTVAAIAVTASAQREEKGKGR